jgi:uncharacterized cupin superfamily protein
VRNIKVQRRRALRSIRQDGIGRNQRALRDSDFTTAQEKKYFAWAKVIKARSESNDIDVILDTGIRLNHVSVSSKAWAGSNASKGFGSRDLPPKDALVLIVFPYGTVDDALVLCSAFTLFGQHANKWKSDILISGKEREEKRVMENGDMITYDKDTGAAKMVINNAEVEITTAGAVKITPASGQSITLNGGLQGANDFPTCIMTGAPHCLDALQSVKVP